MKKYKNLSGKSGVVAYEPGTAFIKVKFIDGSVYTYTYKSAGQEITEKMKQLAKAGKGLSTYISQTVKDKFDKQA